jgi:hypothetical protein
MKRVSEQGKSKKNENMVMITFDFQKCIAAYFLSVLLFRKGN